MKDFNNILLNVDSYKVTHYKGYHPKTEYIYSYFESRGGEYPTTVFFGLQYIIKRYLTGKVVTEEKIQEAKELFTAHFGNDKLFNEEGWRYILEKYDGKLPVKIEAVPEGTEVNTHNVLMTIQNTDPKVFWLTNYLETLLVQAWFPTSVCTLSHHIKQDMLKFAEKNGTPDLVNFKLHDFGCRGVSSMESAAIGGAAHLVNFLGTDTVPSLVMAKEYYNTPIAGFSIPAAEHSTITSWGKTEELIAFNNMLEQFPEGLVAVVSDSYDIYNACENLWGTILKNKVMNRNGTLVIRPDSGDPCTVVMKCLEILGEKFGTTINDKGYKVLDPHVRLIQGDGVNQNSIHQILTVMDENKWSIDNIAFGMGGALLQKLNRDTQKFAFKCSWTQQDGKELNVSKSPVTDQGKNSKAGKLALFKTNTKTFVTNNDTDNPNNVLRTVFLNGELLIDESLEEIRERTKNP